MNKIVWENLWSQTFNRHDIQWACYEVKRQGDGPEYVGYMLDGLAYARLFGSDTPIGYHNLLDMNGLVLNREVKGFRRTAVTFANTVKEAADWRDIERQMVRLLDFQEDIYTDEFVKTFLDIHPFEDGNGRVASLLYNIKKGITRNPVILPDYYGG